MIYHQSVHCCISCSRLSLTCFLVKRKTGFVEMIMFEMSKPFFEQILFPFVGNIPPLTFVGSIPPLSHNQTSHRPLWQHTVCNWDRRRRPHGPHRPHRCPHHFSPPPHFHFLFCFLVFGHHSTSVPQPRSQDLKGCQRQWQETHWEEYIDLQCEKIRYLKRTMRKKPQMKRRTK